MNKIFYKFKNANKASMICVKNETLQNYDCKLGFDTEANLFRHNKFEYKSSVCEKEVNDFIKSLGAIDTKDVSDIKRWVVINDKSNVDIYSFGGSSEIHFTKNNTN